MWLWLNNTGLCNSPRKYGGNSTNGREFNPFRTCNDL